METLDVNVVMRKMESVVDGGLVDSRGGKLVDVTETCESLK